MLADPRRRARALGLALALLLAGCATRPLLERAIAARGGAVPGVILRAEARVYRFAPGRWRYTRSFLAPDAYAWQLETAMGIDTHVFDGRVVRSFVAGELVASDASPAAPLRSQARWTAVALLDALAAPEVTLQPLPAAELPRGAREGLRAAFADGAVYRLAFDADTALIWMQGPLDLAPLARGDVTVEFSDAQRLGGVLLPRTARYAVDGERLAVETLLAVCRTPAGLTADAFAQPETLPTCALPDAALP